MPMVTEQETIIDDPVLQELLLAHIEPAMQVLLEHQSKVLRKSNYRKIRTLVKTDPFSGYIYRIDVIFDEKCSDNWYYFKIRPDGSIKY